MGRVSAMSYIYFMALVITVSVRCKKIEVPLLVGTMLKLNNSRLEFV